MSLIRPFSLPKTCAILFEQRSQQFWRQNYPWTLTLAMYERWYSSPPDRLARWMDDYSQGLRGLGRQALLNAVLQPTHFSPYFFLPNPMPTLVRWLDRTEIFSATQSYNERLIPFRSWRSWIIWEACCRCCRWGCAFDEMRRRCRCRRGQVHATFEMTMSSIKQPNNWRNARCDLQRIRDYEMFNCGALTSFVRGVTSRPRSRSARKLSGILPATSPVERQVRNRNFMLIGTIEWRL